MSTESFNVGQAVTVILFREEKTGVVTKLHPYWDHVYWVVFEDGEHVLCYSDTMREVTCE